MGGGAVVAIAAAARERRILEIVDAFRLAGATTPGRAQSSAALGVDTSRSEVQELIRLRVLTQTDATDRMYLDENAYIARRDARRDRARLLMLSVVLIVAGLIGVGLYLNFSGL